MAVVLRLARLGKHKAPIYRIVAAEKQSRRDGRFLDIVGTYNPLTSPASVSVKEDKISKWLDVGAKPTETVRALIKRSLPGKIEAKGITKRTRLRKLVGREKSVRPRRRKHRHSTA